MRTEVEIYYNHTVLERLPVDEIEIVEVISEGPQGASGGGLGGSIAQYQVAFGSGTNTIAGDDNLEWDGANLDVGSLIQLSTDGSASFANANVSIDTIGQITAPQISVNDVFTFVTHFQPESRPLSPQEGDVYQDSTDHHLYHYNGTAWSQLDPAYVLSEVPSGVVDGVNTVFTTAHNFSSISVYNGLRQTPGVDFIVTAANAITFTSPPTVGSSILVDYLRA